jgi:hypothetical protein
MVQFLIQQIMQPLYGLNWIHPIILHSDDVGWHIAAGRVRFRAKAFG